jgi:integrase/recombinase XerD
LVVRGDGFRPRREDVAMTTTSMTTDVVPSYLDVARLALASFLARYREPTLTAYKQDLAAFIGWCDRYDVQPLRVTRGRLELYLRHLEQRGYAPATIGRRFGTVSTFCKYAPNDHALVCLLGMLGLRVSEACPVDIADIRYAAGYELLHVLGKGAKPADIPLPIPVLRAVREAIDGPDAGPILRTRTGRRMDRAGASRALTRVARAAGITREISPHGLRRTFCTTGLVAGIGIRDMQYAKRHADPRTTLRNDMAKTNLDRHAAHAVAAYLAGMSTG